ncbi:MAG: hypothetical protein P4L26_00850 [Terracidiphilus sp.]|nr:hypothetical protein [Terracidiphilus sp.]
MTSPNDKNAASANLAAKGSISLAKLSPELARSNFHALLLANPNYFGNLAESKFKSILSIQGDTAYESLGCVGYNPQFEQLRATINIKLDGGYSGGICSAGSNEYVRFYLSYDGGTTWLDQGLTAVNVFDVPGPKPLEYAVTLGISPKEDFCFFQNLPLVRAILSWNFPPPANSPAWVPVWGDTLDGQIQIDGYELIPFPIFLEAAKVTLPEEFSQAIDLGQSLEAAKPKALSPADLHKLYSGTSVPQHRYLAKSLAAAIKAPAAQLGQAKSFAGISDIDLSGLVGSVLNTNGDTAYEQLECVGLNPATSQLTGVLTIKQSAGYAGGPCTAGSTEYVAFWVNWGAGFEYAGTTSVSVHDFSAIPAGGLDYTVFLPVNLADHAQPCGDGPLIATVRGVLSWDTPPSTTNPNAPVVWGNSLDGLILVPPGPAVSGGNAVPFLASVGAVDVTEIGSDGRITNATINAETGLAFPWGPFVDSPFGGQISLAGVIFNGTLSSKYRIMKAPHGSGSFAPVINGTGALNITILSFPGGVPTETPTTIFPDVNGYYTYQNVAPNSVIGDLLGIWTSAASDTGNAYDLRVDLSVNGNPADDIHSNVVTVLINNQQPTALLTIVGECGEFSPGDTITGTFTATATDFGSFSFQILPTIPAAGAIVTPAGGSSSYLGGVIGDPGVSGQTVTIDTTHMQDCGYSFTLYVYDRTNVGSGETVNWNYASTGFCLQGGS